MQALSKKICSLLLIASLGLILGCQHGILAPVGGERNISDIYNIIWTYEQPGFATMTLIFEEERFHGYDGCNWFGARYTVLSDQVVPQDMTMTERACGLKTHSLAPLSQAFAVAIGDKSLTLSAQGKTFAFKSDLTATVSASSLLFNWQMQDSNDPAFAQMQTDGLLPTLGFGEDRRFVMSWDCSAQNIFGCSEIEGLFGISETGKIRLYQGGSRYSAAGSEFALRVLESTRFSVTENGVKSWKLILEHPESGRRYSFISVTR